MRAAAIVIAALSLSGCYNFRGPEPVYNSRGVVAGDRFGDRKGALFNRFSEIATQAAACPSLTDVACTSDAAADKINRRFMLAGYALIYSDCNDYFAVMGRNQSRSRIFRSSVAPVVNLLTGLLSLRNFSDGRNEQDLLQILTLGSNAATSTLDIFDENLLFGANNIDAVHQLTNRALATHATSTFDQDEPITFEQAVINILDNQDLCRPSRIMLMTRSAIANGDVEARPSGNGGGRENPPKDDDPKNDAGGDKDPDNPDNGSDETPASGLTTTSVTVPPQ